EDGAARARRRAGRGVGPRLGTRVATAAVSKAGRATSGRARRAHRRLRDRARADPAPRAAERRRLGRTRGAPGARKGCGEDAHVATGAPLTIIASSSPRPRARDWARRADEA